MSIFFKAFLVTVLLGTISCNYVKNVKLLTGGKLDRKNFVETIPFTYSKGIIVIEGEVNGDSTKRAFIFDTGAFNSKIEKELADSLGLKKIAEKDNSTAQGVSRKIDVTRINSLKLGDTVFRNIGAGKLEYDSGSVSPCLAGHGLIGANLIKLAHWKIDFKNQLLSFSDTPFKGDAQKPLYPLSFDRPLLSGVPDVDIKIQGKKASNILFDLGYNGGLVLPKYLSGAFETPIEETIIDYSTSGIYGTNLDTLLTKRLDINFGGFTAEIPVEFSSIGKALIGNDFLEHFTIFIDYKKKEILLQQESEIHIEDQAGFIPGVLTDSLWIVNRISHDAGLSLGDTLIAVNGKKPAELFSDNCEYFFGIRDFLKDDSVNITTFEGKEVILNK